MSSPQRERTPNWSHRTTRPHTSPVIPELRADPALAAVPEDPTLREGRRQQALAGGYRLPAPHPADREDVTIVGVGAVMPEAVAVAALLAAEGVNAGVVCLTSPDLLFRSFQQRAPHTRDRQRLPGPAVPGLDTSAARDRSRCTDRRRWSRSCDDTI